MKSDINISDMSGSGYTETGFIIVNVLTAKGALPIEGALVTITGNDTENKNFCITGYSEVSGATPKLSLPAPSPKYYNKSDSIKPYATYRIDVEKEGYYMQSDITITVFCGITSIQSAELLPI